MATAPQIVFIDGSVKDIGTLMSAFGSEVEQVILDPNASGLDQMARYLDGRSGIGAIHVLSEGSSGHLLLGNDWIDNDNLASHADALKRIGAALAPGGDLLLYGCDVAAGSEGDRLISGIAQLARADVAASTDHTGAAAKGGNWTLEAQHGRIETASLLNAQSAAAYAQVLAAPVVSASAGTTVFTGSTPLVVDAALGLSASTPTLASALVSIGSGFSTGEDVLAFANDGSTMGNIAGSYDGSSGVLTLASAGGTATVAQWQAALRSVTYVDALSSGRSGALRSISFVVNDGTVDSAAGTKNLSVIAPRSFIVTSNADAGAGTLRQAIIDANANGGHDTISFNIAGAGIHQIALQSALPTLSDGVTLDGYSQYGAGGPLIELDGAAAGSANGLQLDAGASGSTVTGLVVYRFSASGILVNGASNVTLVGNFLGINVAGNGGLGNGDDGIHLTGASNVTIGSTGTAARNVISGNADNGIEIGASSSSVAIANNAIGTNRAGTVAVGNAHSGIYIPNASSVTIGGMTVAERNLVSGNGGDGIVAVNSSAISIYGNYIGTNASGAGILANGGNGIVLDTVGNAEIGRTSAGNLVAGNGSHGLYLRGVGNSSIVGNRIGTNAAGTAALANQSDGIFAPNITGTAFTGNLISGNQGEGIRINFNAAGDVFKGNYIGVSADGTTAIGNTGNGMSFAGSGNGVIGGSGVGEGNVISGNGGDGIRIDGSGGFVIRGNRIGTNAAGTAALGNGQRGIFLLNNADNNDIGGSGLGEGNLIAGNAMAGINLTHSASVRIKGNLVGVNASGTAIPNGSSGTWDGVYIDQSSHDVLIGGTVAGEGNTIAWNARSGIRLNNDAGTGTSILGNSIYANGAIGIDLQSDGVTANDAGDADGGANNQQNYPVLGAVRSSGGMTYVDGTLSSSASAGFRIEFFASTSADPSGYGEGQRFLGFLDVTTDAAGLASFSTALAAATQRGELVSATATRLSSGDSSEFGFSVAIPLNHAPSGGDDGVTLPEDGSHVFTAAEFLFTDPSEAVADSLHAVRITSLPGSGLLTNNGVALNAGDLVLKSAIDAGQLVYTPAANANGTTSFTFQVQDDGGTANGGVDLDASANTMTLNVTAVNDAPVVTTSGGSGSFTQGGSPVAVDPGVTLADIDSNTLASATVAITGNFASGQDVLAFAGNPGTMGNIAGSYDASTGVLSLSSAGASATVGQWQAALRSVTYANGAASPSVPARTLSLSVNDGTAASSVQTRQLSISTLATGDIAVLGFNSDQHADLNADGIGDARWSIVALAELPVGAVIHFTDAGLDAGGVFFQYPSVDSHLSWTLTRTVAAGTVLVMDTSTGVNVADLNGAATGTGGLSDYGTVSGTLGGASGNVSEVPFNELGDQIIVYQGTAGQATDASFIYALSTQQGTQVPSLGSWQVSGGVNNSQGSYLPPGLVAGVTAVALTTNVDNLSNGPGTFGSPNRGFDNMAYQGTLAGSKAQLLLAIADPAHWVGSDSTPFDFAVGAGALYTSNFMVYQAPVITASGGSTVYVENAAATPVDAGLVVSDADSATLASATVRIGSGFVAGQDTLAFANDGSSMGNIAASYDAATGVLSLGSAGATATLAQWQAALRAVTYSNSSDTPSVAARSLVWAASDGNMASADSTKTVVVNAVDDAPTLTASAGTTILGATGSAAVVDAGLTLADVDNTTLASATVRVASGFQAGEDVLAFANNGSTMGNIAGSYDPATGVLSLSSAGASATLAQWQAALRAVTYRDSLGTNPSGQNRSISFVVNDGSLDSNAGSKTVSVISPKTFVVTTVADSGAGSLRQAIIDANANGGADTIVFSIAAPGVQLISLGSALPTIADTVTIDGSTQPGTGATTLIRIDGSTAGAGVNGLNFSAGASGSFVSGLAITRFTQAGIALNGLNGFTLQASYLGTDTASSAGLGNGDSGVYMNNASNVDIGGTTAAQRNVISGNAQMGVYATNSNHISVTGNYIGTDASGNVRLANQQDGVQFYNVTNSNVGSAVAGGGNLLSGNSANGLRLHLGNNITVLGNTIGLNAAGTAALGNGDSGIHLWTVNNITVGGSTAAARNVVSGNGSHGWDGLFVDASSYITVQGNYVGTDATGTVALGNQNYGIRVDGPSNNVAIGGAAGTGNVVGGNGAAGIGMRGPSAGTLVQGNRIGMGSTGAALANGAQGVLIANTSNTNRLVDNAIAYNTGTGVAMSGTGTGNLLSGNSIHSNGQRGIDLGADGVTANDPGDADTGANQLQNFPVLASVVRNGGSLTIDGVLDSAANTTYVIEFFASSAADPSGYGQGERYLGSVTVTTDGSGHAVVHQVLTVATTRGEFVSATATNQATNDSSEFGLALQIAVNHAPAGTDNAVTLLEDGTHVFTAAEFGFSDPGEAVADGLAAVRITTLPAAGALSLNGVPVTAGSLVLKADLDAGLLVYAPAANANGAAYASFTFQVKDDGGTDHGGVDLDATPNTMTINVTAVNDAPVTTTSPGSATYTENNGQYTGAVAVDPGFSVSDIDNLTLGSAQVGFVSGYRPGDSLVFLPNAATMGNIRGASLAQGVGFTTNFVSLVSDGNTATLAQWTAALRSIGYFHTTSDPGAASRVVNFVVNDGAAASSGSTRTVNVVPVNNAPVVTASGGSASFIEEGLAVAVDPGLAVGDADNTALASATVSIGGGFQASQDSLAFANNGSTMGNIVASYDAASGVLSLSSAGGTATLAQWQAALRSVSYANSSSNPSTALRSISFAVNDGNLGSAAATRTMAVTAVNTAPVVVVSGGSGSFTEGGAPAVVDAAITVGDVDTTTLSSAVVGIGSGFQASQDSLAFANDGSTMGNIAASYDAATGVLSLSSAGGTATVAQWQAALRSVSYLNASSDPSTATRSISFTVNDGALNSAVSTRNLAVVAVNNAPVVSTSGGQGSFTEGGAPTVIDAGLTLADVDSASLASAVVSIGSGFQSSQDLLAFANNGSTMGNIAASYDAATGVLSLSSAGGTATLAQWQVALRSVSYSNASSDPSTATRSISFTVNDGALNSAVSTRNLAVVAVNNAPVVSTSGGQGSFTEGGAPTVIDAGLTLADVDSASLASAVVSIGSGFQSSQDLLAFANNGSTMGNIAASYDAATGVLSLSSAGGAATLAQWQAALCSVSYSNGSSDPSTATRSIAFTVNDGTLNSAVASRNLAVVAVDNAPVVSTSGGQGSFTEGGAPTVIDAGLTLADVDSASLASAAVSIGSGFQSSQDVLAFANNGSTMGNIAASYDAATGVLSLSSAGGTATLAQWQAALRSVSYSNASSDPSTATRSIAFTVNDGTLNSAVATRNLAVVAVNDAPVLTGSSGSTVYTEHAAPIAVDAHLTLTDADDATLAAATVRIAGGFQPSQDALVFANDGSTMGNITASYDAATGVLSLASAGGSATFAQWQAALRAVSYLNTSDDPAAAPRSIDFEVGSARASKAVMVLAVNDLPIVSTSSGSVAYASPDVAVVVDPGLVLSDADSATLVSATVSLGNGFVPGIDLLAYGAKGSGILGSFDADAGVLTLVSDGSAPTLAQWQDALRAVTFTHGYDGATNATRAVRFVVNDGEADSAGATRQVQLAVVAVAPPVTPTMPTSPEPPVETPVVPPPTVIVTPPLVTPTVPPIVTPTLPTTPSIPVVPIAPVVPTAPPSATPPTVAPSTPTDSQPATPIVTPAPDKPAAQAPQRGNPARPIDAVHPASDVAFDRAPGYAATAVGLGPIPRIGSLVGATFDFSPAGLSFLNASTPSLGPQRQAAAGEGSGLSVGRTNNSRRDDEVEPVESSAPADAPQTTVRTTVEAVAAAVTLGAAWGALRVAGVLATSLAARSVWTHIDPIPLLAQGDDEELPDPESTRDEDVAGDGADGESQAMALLDTAAADRRRPS